MATVKFSRGSAESGWDAQHTCARGTTDHQTELDTLLDILLPADLNLREN